jgi:hypothetical protein
LYTACHNPNELVVYLSRGEGWYGDVGIFGNIALNVTVIDE